MRKIHDPFSRMTETGHGYHSNEVRVKKLDRKAPGERVREGVGGGGCPWNRRVEKSADRDDEARTIGEGQNDRGRPDSARATQRDGRPGSCRRR